MVRKYVRGQLRSRTTLQQRQQLWRLRAAAMRRLTNWYGVVSRVVPMSVAVCAKEGIQLVGRLDYPKHPIAMTVASAVQMDRLHACKKEPDTVQWIEEFMQPGDVFYDIGANVGAYAFVADAVAQGDCRIYAFEPSFATFAALSENILLNRSHSRIVPLQIALSNSTSLLQLQFSSVTPGAALHQLTTRAGTPQTATSLTQTLLSYRLDDLVQEFGLEPPTHIKLDVDGAELRVLQGAEITLAKPHVRSLLIEIDEEEPTSAAVLAILAQSGFVVRSRVARPGRATIANYVFVKDTNHA